MRRLYTLLLYLLLPYIVFHLLWRGRKQPGYLRHIGERFGYYPLASQGGLYFSESRTGRVDKCSASTERWWMRYAYPPYPTPRRPSQPILWLHAVSVGETRAAAPLIESLLQRYPHHRILLTHMTPTGRETG
ncbi:MAG: glycosyltransferase N-terminal domain-containing protein, partial [Sulfuricellaceae bacterium]